MTPSSLSNLITTHLGRMKAWAACNSLDWVTCYPLHFTLAYIVYRESRTCQVVYIHVHYGVHGEMYIGIDQNYWYLVTRTSSSPPCFPRGPLRQHPLAWESPKWADNLAGPCVERTVRQRPAKLSAHLGRFSSHRVLSRGEHGCRSFGWQDISNSGLATNFFLFDNK